MAVTLVNTPAASALGTTSCTGTYNGYVPVAGDLLVAMAWQADTAAKINSPAFTNAQGWTSALDVSNAGLAAGLGNAAVQVWALAAAGGDAAPTFTPSFGTGGGQTHSCGCVVYAFQGANMSNFAGNSWLDTWGVYISGTVAATVTFSATTSASPSLAGGYAVSGFAQEATAATQTFTDTGSGWTTVVTGNGASNILATYSGRQANPSTAGALTDQGSFSASASAFGAGAVVVVRPVAPPVIVPGMQGVSGGSIAALGQAIATASQW